MSKAIEQLGQSGDDKVDVRIGGIYYLGQIVRDSPDQLNGPIMETLTAFLRGHMRSVREQSNRHFQAWGLVCRLLARGGRSTRAHQHAC